MPFCFIKEETFETLYNDNQLSIKYKLLANFLLLIFNN